jgi:hypothetical protein
MAIQAACTVLVEKPYRKEQYRSNERLDDIKMYPKCDVSVAQNVVK